MRNTKNIFILFFTLLLSLKGAAQETYRQQIVDYIAAYAPMAIAEMKRTGFPASIKIAQGIHESGAGRSNLVSRSNNHFGMKCKSNWTGEKVYHDDDEAGECFRKYESPQDSYSDHSDYLKSQSRYSFLFKLDPNDHVAWATGLKKAGYATSPVYAETIIKYVETYQLNDLNQFADVEDSTIDLTQYLAGFSSSLPNKKVAEKAIPKAAEETKNNSNYPEGVFKLDGIKVTYAEKGTSLLAIAKKYKINLSSLLVFNDFPKNIQVLQNDQLVYLQRKKNIGNKVTIALKNTKNKVQKSKTSKKEKYAIHIVKKGESLWTIANKYKVTIDSIKDINKIKSNDLQIGQSLKILK